MARSYRAIGIIVVALVTGLLNAPAKAATSSTFFVSQTPSVEKPLVTFHGVVKPAVTGAEIRIQIELDGRWEDALISTKTHPLGTWKVSTIPSGTSNRATYRAQVTHGGRTFFTNSQTLAIKKVAQLSDPSSALSALLKSSGPGNRIFGSDVSRWQHPNDKPINFAKMYKAGMRFVMIKASDTRDDSDALAQKYLVMDRNAAQAAGLYTGFYHYATLPNTSSRKVVIADAKAQAQRAVWRLASIGGYNERDLPYALDLENNCVSYVNKKCVKYSPKRFNTLWAETWLETVQQKTGRKPFFYSYPSFLERAMKRSEKLRSYPLWLSHFGINPANPTAEPGRKVVGCFVHAWTTANCNSLWQIWQFSSCGIAPKYGVPGSRLDLNVYRGDANSFMKLIQGVWEPLQGDYLPVNESTTIQITAITATTTNKKVVIGVEVKRATGEPVVTGSVEFFPELLGDSPTALNFTQQAIRDSSGLYSLSMKGFPAGIYFGRVEFKDPTGTHATSSARVEFSLRQGVEKPPKPKVEKPKITNPTLDGCKRQIKL